ncbi:DegT/DnrJ/EryC1/StrS family aminotransferase [Vreelandella utahensis]|uniref:DegT/DnrJ/EryC1/StrS family aminotransferase n=1 Tax=Vreelandella halophila TaxID=86177 RepID=UPI0015C39427|nr:DegT/DnrJ/EryC1/StrS family aminotransferase [Halomonas utahensis]
MIPKAAYDPENGSRKARFFPSARRAWLACLQGLSPRRILLPAYIGYTDKEGSGVLDPIDELKTPFSFYPVGTDLLANSDTIMHCLVREPDIDVVLLIHYFGWPGGDVSTIRSICDQMGVVLVEDCAHAFHWGQPDPSLGIRGDFALYSIHKYLATATGGLLHAVHQKEYPKAMVPEEQNIDPAVLDVLARADLDAIAGKRRENLARVLDELDDMDGLIPLRTEIPLVPQSMPVWVEGHKMREKLYFRMMERGVPATALYHRLHHSLERTLFPQSFEVSEHVLNLPIHQDMSADMIKYMFQEIRASLRELRK